MSSLLVYGPHAIVGLMALVFFWRTLLAAKGSTPHRTWGRRYLMTLLPLLLSVLPITAQAVVAEGPATVVQLVYLAVVLSTAGWTAWRAVQDRGDVIRFTGPVYRALAGTLLGLGSVLMVIGIARWDVLAFGFSMIGIIYGGAMLGFLGRRPDDDWWLGWHLNGICLLFAATHASFVGLLLRVTLPQYDGRVMHASAQLGTIAFAYLLRQWMARRYQRRRTGTEPNLQALA